MKPIPEHFIPAIVDAITQHILHPVNCVEDPDREKKYSFRQIELIRQNLTTSLSNFHSLYEKGVFDDVQVIEETDHYTIFLRNVVQKKTPEEGEGKIATRSTLLQDALEQASLSGYYLDEFPNKTIEQL